MEPDHSQNPRASERMILLYLKALIWSVFVAYGERTVAAIINCLTCGEVDENDPELSETHLGDGLRFLIQHLPGSSDRELLAGALKKVKNSRPSLIYGNMVIEVGHYVRAREAIPEVPVDRFGVIYQVEENQVCVLFRLEDGRLVDRKAHPSQITPLYTLTVGED